MRAVIPALHYADLLAVILPAWVQVLGAEALTVVTTPGDHETHEVASAHGVGLVATDAWSRDEAILNKAAALDDAFGITPGYRRPPAPGELCISLDADVYPFGRFPNESEIQPDVLYGCARYHCLTPRDLRRHRRGRTPRERLQLIPPKVRGEPYARCPNTRENALRSASRCLGYFQLFRYREGIRFGSYRTAGKYDLEFSYQFPHREALWDFYVLHLGEQSRANWRGRVTARWSAA